MKEALKLALDALDNLMYWDNGKPDYDEAREAITAIKEALAQPEQEPVPAAMKTVIEAMQQDPDYAWGWHCNIAMSFVDAGGDHYTGNQGAARFMRTLANVEPAHELPFSPPQRTWVGLTHEEIDKAIGDNQRFGGFRKVGFAYDLELVLKEKNT